MSDILTLTPGQVLFKQGDASQSAYIILEGEIDIFTTTGQGNVLLACLGRGQIVGEMGLIDGMPRSASAAARTSGQVRMITREEVGRVMAGLPEEYRLLLSALSERLRETNQKLAKAITHHHEMQIAPGNKPITGAHVRQVMLRPGNEAMMAHLPPAGVIITSLPFRVGGLAAGEQPNPLDWNNLAIPGANLGVFARNHFAIQKNADGLFVTDRGSPAGTMVNGTRIGHGAPDYKQPLSPGSNRVAAGDDDSPYQFDVIWD